MTEKKVLKIVLSTPVCGQAVWLANLICQEFNLIVGSEGPDKISGSKTVTMFPFVELRSREECIDTLRSNTQSYYVCRDPLGQLTRNQHTEPRMIAISIRPEEFRPGSAEELFDTGILMVLMSHVMKNYYKEAEEPSMENAPKFNLDYHTSRTAALLAENVYNSITKFIKENDFELQLHLETFKFV